VILSHSESVLFLTWCRYFACFKTFLFNTDSCSTLWCC